MRCHQAYWRLCQVAQSNILPTQQCIGSNKTSTESPRGVLASRSLWVREHLPEGKPQVDLLGYHWCKNTWTHEGGLSLGRELGFSKQSCHQISPLPDLSSSLHHCNLIHPFLPSSNLLHSLTFSSGHLDSATMRSGPHTASSSGQSICQALLDTARIGP